MGKFDFLFFSKFKLFNRHLKILINLKEKKEKKKNFNGHENKAVVTEIQQNFILNIDLEIQIYF